MVFPKTPPLPVAHSCPVCHQPQTRIRRKLNEDQHGATSYVCVRLGECSIAIDLRNVDTWVAV